MVYKRLDPGSFLSRFLKPLYLPEREAMRTEELVGELKRFGLIGADDVLVGGYEFVEEKNVLFFSVDFHRSGKRFGRLRHGPSPKPAHYRTVKKD